MRSAQQFNILACDKVKAIAQVNNGANYGGMLIVSPPRFFFSPFHSAKWVRFPKIRARPKPIVILVAIKNFRAIIHGFFSDNPVAPVIAENK